MQMAVSTTFQAVILDCEFKLCSAMKAFNTSIIGC